MAASTEEELLCPDWVYSTGSNVHVAKNRGWFTDYVPFKSTLGSLAGGLEMKVEGIGTVVLPTKKNLNASGAKNHTTLRLVEVLHVPSILCNIVGPPFHDEYCGFSISGGLTAENGKKLACFDRARPLLRIKLSGPPVGPIVGPSVIKEGGSYWINAFWSEYEQKKWDVFKKSMASTTTIKEEAKYTPAEKRWLKKNFGGEYHFLMTHGLSIYKEEDREEGRRVLRAIMDASDEDEEDGLDGKPHDSDDDEDNTVHIGLLSLQG